MKIVDYDQSVKTRLEEAFEEKARAAGMTVSEFEAYVERETADLTASECVELAFPLIEVPEQVDARKLWGGAPSGSSFSNGSMGRHAGPRNARYITSQSIQKEES